MKRALSDGALCLMHYLMTKEPISNKVKTANHEKEGKPYAIYNITKSGTVILGETQCRLWNKLIGCQYKLPFEKWALVVWDALVDLSKGDTAIALEKGLSTEIATKAQRDGDYEWVVKRLYDGYERICNNKGGASSEGDRDNNGSSAPGRTVYVDGEPVVINVNADGIHKTYKFPDSTGRAALRFDLGIVGVNVERR
jgi:hypothetical protein